MSLLRHRMPTSLATHCLSTSCFSPVPRQDTYFQGQYSDDGRREYFYYVDHQGRLFLTETKMKNFTSCIKDKHFLKFFFSRVVLNDVGRYLGEFPYLSRCGSERNYISCDDTPLVFTEVLNESNSTPLVSLNHTGSYLTRPFEPSQLCMVPDTGRVYHPAPAKAGGRGLVADKLSILWTQERRFTFGNGEDKPPTDFEWRGEKIRLTNELARTMMDNYSR